MFDWLYTQMYAGDPSVFKVFLIWGRASLEKQQDQYLMSWPANHKSSSGREAFSGARWCSAVEWSVSPAAQRSGRCPWQQWMEVLDSGPALLPPHSLLGNSNTLSFPFAPHPCLTTWLGRAKFISCRLERFFCITHPWVMGGQCSFFLWFFSRCFNDAMFSNS